jgi:NADH-quinone oxidoreductase subunit H
MLAFFLFTIVEILMVFTVVLMMVAYMTLMERKVLGHIQVRFGPNRVGPFGIFNRWPTASN